MQHLRRGLISVVTLSALVACKSSEGSGTGWNNTGSGSGSAGAPIVLPPDTGSAAPALGSAITRPFFYKVEKAGKTSYLIGTFHLGVDAEKQLPSVVFDALAAAKSFAMEVDPMDPAGLAAYRRTDGVTLDAELGPEYWAKLEAIVGADKQVLDLLRLSKPYAAAVRIQVKGLPEGVPMDLLFSDRAKKQDSAISFLESATVQIKVIERWIDLRMLKWTIDHFAETQKKVEEAMVAYLAGDEAALATYMLDREGMKEVGFTDSELELAAKQLLYDRNESWLPRLEELFAKGDAFVAVGAGHLIGPRSVVELLQAKGYTVTRVGA